MFRDKIGNDGFFSFKRPPIIATVDGSTYDLQSGDELLHITYTLIGTVTITIPSAQIIDRRIIDIKDADFNAGTNNITIQTEGSEKIEGSLNPYVMDTDGEELTLYVFNGNLFAK